MHAGNPWGFSDIPGSLMGIMQVIESSSGSLQLAYQTSPRTLNGSLEHHHSSHYMLKSGHNTMHHRDVLRISFACSGPLSRDGPWGSKESRIKPSPALSILCTVSMTKRLQALRCEPAGQGLPLFTPTRNGVFHVGLPSFPIERKHPRVPIKAGSCDRMQRRPQPVPCRYYLKW